MQYAAASAWLCVETQGVIIDLPTNKKQPPPRGCVLKLICCFRWY